MIELIAPSPIGMSRASRRHRILECRANFWMTWYLVPGTNSKENQHNPTVTRHPTTVTMETRPCVKNLNPYSYYCCSWWRALCLACLCVDSIASFAIVSPLSLSSSFGAIAVANRQRPPVVSLFGISEWRDMMMMSTEDSTETMMMMTTVPVVDEMEGLPKEICVLPFPYQEVLLQGETKQLRLYEERFIELFEDCQNNHCSVVAMGLIASNGLIQTVPLAEVEAYTKVPGFGIFATIRVVGRANLLKVVQEGPYIKAVCSELTDKLPPSLEE